jgi:hypothetical protein
MIERPLRLKGVFPIEVREKLDFVDSKTINCEIEAKCSWIDCRKTNGFIETKRWKSECARETLELMPKSTMINCWCKSKKH